MAAKKTAKQRGKQAGRQLEPSRGEKKPQGKTASRKTGARQQPAASSDTLQSTPQESSPAGETNGAKQFPVVGIGASAGGLEALRELLEHLPTDTGMAFVFCQHLAPNHKSSLPEIAGRVTKLPVREIADGMKLEPDQLFVVPAGHNVGVMHGVLQLLSYGSEDSHRHMPVDYFFRSLAEDLGPAAIGVILSGTGSDGTLGLREIKSAGGITMVQSPESARYGGMPGSAPDDVVDLRLPPQDGELQLRDRWNAVRLRPYRTADKKVDGAVLVLLDIHEQKLAQERQLEQEKLAAALEYAQGIVAALREPLVVLDNELRVVSANPAFYRTFQVNPDETEHRPFYGLGNQQWDIPELRKLLEEIIPRNRAFEDYRVEHDFPEIGRRRLLLNGRRIDRPDGRPHLILLAMEDITNG